MQVQEPVAQPESGLDQGTPGLPPADAVHPQAPPVLERFHRGGGTGPEEAVGVGETGQTDLAEPVLQVGDGRPLVVRLQGEGGVRDYRYAWSSCKSWALPRAPTIRA